MTEMHGVGSLGLPMWNSGSADASSPADQKCDRRAPEPPSELVYWDETLPGFGVKVTPAGRKVFIVLYRTAGAGSRLASTLSGRMAG